MQVKALTEFCNMSGIGERVPVDVVVDQGPFLGPERFQYVTKNSYPLIPCVEKDGLHQREGGCKGRQGWRPHCTCAYFAGPPLYNREGRLHEHYIDAVLLASACLSGLCTFVSLTTW